MDRIRILCRDQDRETRRRILAAYYLGAVVALKSPPKRAGYLSAMLRNQAG